jgi:hypothetical protein
MQWALSLSSCQDSKPEAMLTPQALQGPRAPQRLERPPATPVFNSPFWNRQRPGGPWRMTVNDPTIIH